jgi:hypothetical protein
VREFDLFLPLYYNDGSPIEPSKFQKLQRQLLEEFEGFTYFPQPHTGVWRVEDLVYRDEIVIYRVVSRKVRAARRFLKKFKEKLKRSFVQEEIFIVERTVRVL